MATNFWLKQLKKGFENELEKIEREKNMENKMEIMSNEVLEINNIIALSKEDDDVKNILLSEISREFSEEILKEKAEQVFYQDQVIEIIELTKHNNENLTFLITEILKNPVISDLLFNHFLEIDSRTYRD